MTVQFFKEGATCQSHNSFEITGKLRGEREMAYQIGLWGVLREGFILPIVIVYAIIIGVVFIRKVKGKDESDKSYRLAMRIVAIIVPIPLILLMFFVSPSSSTGWVLDKETLHIKTLAKSDIDISTAQIALIPIQSSGPWRRPAGQVGLHYSAVDIGTYKLQNGKTATIFYYDKPQSAMIVFSGNHYYVLSHPGVELLYEELKRRGVGEVVP